jgi:hypothetical protein
MVQRLIKHPAGQSIQNKRKVLNVLKGTSHEYYQSSFHVMPQTSTFKNTRTF